MSSAEAASIALSAVGDLSDSAISIGKALDRLADDVEKAAQGSIHKARMSAQSKLAPLAEIDDVLAFIIKMPTMHRVSCFRDVIVFAVFLYQRWIYKVDATRRNEFGTTGEEEQEKKQAKKTKKTQ